MIYLTTINALPVKKKMKKAFSENYSFTRFNLAISDVDHLLASNWSKSGGHRQSVIMKKSTGSCIILCVLSTFIFHLIWKFFPQALQLNSILLQRWSNFFFGTNPNPNIIRKSENFRIRIRILFEILKKIRIYSNL